MNVYMDIPYQKGEDLLSVIIPFRITADRLDALDRLGFIEEDDRKPNSVGILVVDDGSPKELSEKVYATCREKGYGYLRLETELQEFSVGRCRNYGAMYSNSTYVFMQDVDLVPYSGFYQELIDEIRIQGLAEDAKKFLMVPYIFMSESGSQEFFTLPKSLRARTFMHYLLEGDDARVEKFSSGTSANLYNRWWYLACGGNSSDFEGWGFEDLEFNTRLVRHLNYFPTPREWQLQRFNFNTVLEYKSWKASYRMFGDMLFYKGTVLFHCWHQTGEASSYMEQKKKNEALFIEKMKEFVACRKEPDPLPDMHAGTTLLMRNNPFTFAREIQPLLGDIVEPTDELLERPEMLESFMKKHAVDRIMFFNPYASEAMLGVYIQARKIGASFLVAERGSLPGSVFFDPNGFLLDSSSYDVEKWDRPLSDEKRQRTIEYFRQERAQDCTLESQGARIGSTELRKRLGIRRWQKVLYVSLQRPSDTVTNYFCGEIGSYANFLRLVEEVSQSLPSGWTMVIKQHPLEDDDMSRYHAIDLGRSHIKDVLDMADCVLTFNSGVGVLAMIWNKPTLLAGAAFYADDRINRQVLAAEDVIRNLKALFTPDQETILRFCSYLINDFYSFGRFTTRRDRLPCGSNITSTRNIEYSVIRGLRAYELHLSNNTKSVVSWNSILFDRYRYAEKEFLSSSREQTTHSSSPGETRAPQSQSITASGSIMRKTRKFIRNPAGFFTDSRLFSFLNK